jgi:hypothetical protein
MQLLGKGTFPYPASDVILVFLAVKWVCLKDIVSSICTVQEAMVASRIRYVFAITLQK